MIALWIVAMLIAGIVGAVFQSSWNAEQLEFRHGREWAARQDWLRSIPVPTAPSGVSRFRPSEGMSD